MFAFFGPSEQFLDIIILFDSSNGDTTIHESDKSLRYDTRAHGAHPERITPCARIDSFQKLHAFRVQCTGKNVMLKYKGNGLLSPRNGNNMGRVGFMGKLQGRRFADGLPDLQTNIDVCLLSYQCHALEV